MIYSNQFRVTAAAGAPTRFQVPAPESGCVVRLVIVDSTLATAGTIKLFTDQDRLVAGSSSSSSSSSETSSASTDQPTKYSDPMYYAIPPLAFEDGFGFWGFDSIIATSPRIPYQLVNEFRDGNLRYLVGEIEHDGGGDVDFDIGYTIVPLEGI